MLNMIEWWLCLVMPPEEVEEIARFRKLTDEQKAMLLSATKTPRCYTEGWFSPAASKRCSVPSRRVCIWPSG